MQDRQYWTGNTDNDLFRQLPPHLQKFFRYRFITDLGMQCLINDAIRFKGSWAKQPEDRKKQVMSSLQLAHLNSMLKRRTA